MSKPILTFGGFAPLLVQQYERYLPTAFDESMTLLQKVNKVIMYLNQIGEATDNVVAQWNEVMEWVLADGITESVITKLDVMVADGTLADIINEELFGTKADITWVTEQLALKADEEYVTNAIDDLKEFVSSVKINVMDFGAVGDGLTDDSVAIQNALNAAVGKELEFPNKTFIIKQLLKIKSNTKLTLSKNTILKRGADIDCLLINDSNGLSGGYTANRNISITGGTIDVNKVQFATKCTPVAFGHCENIYVADVNFINMYQWHYIELSGCKGAIVERCLFDGHAVDSFYEHIQLDLAKSNTTFPWFGVYDNTPCENVVIRNNYFKNGTRGIGTHSSITGIYHRNIIIENNTFHNMRDICISTLDYYECIIQGNKMSESYFGIKVSNSTENRSKGINILNNMITKMNKDVMSRGIQVDDNCDCVVVRGNHIDEISRHGIGVDRSDACVVDGNTVTNCGLAGIWLYGCSNSSIVNNFTQLNNLDGDVDYYDLIVGQLNGASATDCVISNNNVGTLGILRSLNCGIFHNHIGSFVQDVVNTDLLMQTNCIAGTWV